MKLYWNVLRAEGVAAVARRAAERWSEARRKRSFTNVAASFAIVPAVPVLNVSASPLARRLGGVPIQLLDRLEIEARTRPVATLSLHPDHVRLEVETRGQRVAITGPRRAFADPFAADDGFERTLLEAAQRSGARIVHFEGLAGLPLASVLRVMSGPFRTVVSVHDFAPFCVRPHLLESRTPPAFCGASTDPARCGRCLRASWPVDDDALDAHRGAARDILSRADAVVFASRFLRSEQGRLFPGATMRRDEVIEPGIAGAADVAEVREACRPRRLALLGAATGIKGASVFEALAAHAAGRGLDLVALGGGEYEALTRLRSLGVRVHGYYRSGTLQDLLRRNRIDLGLVLSIVPEAFGLTLSEAWSAGVPVLAFDHGSVAERIRRMGGGTLVPPGEGAAGLIATVQALATGRATIAASRVDVPSARDAAARHLALYRELGSS